VSPTPLAREGMHPAKAGNREAGFSSASPLVGKSPPQARDGEPGSKQGWGRFQLSSERFQVVWALSHSGSESRRIGNSWLRDRGCLVAR
jgi:hypothetical protein